MEKIIKNLKIKLCELTNNYIEHHLGRDNTNQVKAKEDILLLTKAIETLKS